MHKRTKQLLFILLLQIVAHAEGTAQTESVSRRGKDLYHYHNSDSDAKSEYPPLTYSPNYYPREGYYDCSPSPVSSFIGRGVNYLLLKVGIVAIVKAILAGLLLLKVPIFFLKMAFLKTFLFPVLIAPLLMHLFTNQQATEMKPTEQDNPPEMTEGMGRMIEDDLSDKVWRSLKMFADTEQCVERVACFAGVYSKDSPSGITFTRLLKLFEQSSPTNLQKRMTSIREAFKTGVRNGSCSEQDFRCHGPELYIQHGGDRTQLL